MSTEESLDPSDRLGSLISVVSFERQDLVSELLTEGDLKTLKHLARKGTPENSLRALTSDLAYRSEEHTSELQSLMRISYAVFCLKKKNSNKQHTHRNKSSQ